MNTRYVQRLMFGKYILHKNFFSTSCVWRHYCKVAFLTFWNTLAVPDLVFIWFSLAHSAGFKQFISFNPVLWLLDSIVFLVAVFVCVEFLRWPAVSAQCVCMRSTWSAWLRSGAGSILAARGWEGEHPWGWESPASASLEQLAVCTSALTGTEPQAFIRLNQRSNFHS